MNERRPDLEELAGDVEAGERERLAAVHELLLRAGPPPELSPQLSEPPAPPRRASVVPLPRRYRRQAPRRLQRPRRRPPLPHPRLRPRPCLLRPHRAR